MGRFLFLLRPAAHNYGPQVTPLLWAPWVVLLLSTLSLSWFFAVESIGKTLMKTLTLFTLWPVLVGSFLSWAAWWRQELLKKIVGRIPPGDLLAGVDWLWRRCPRGSRSLNAAGVVR